MAYYSIQVKQKYLLVVVWESPRRLYPCPQLTQAAIPAVGALAKSSQQSFIMVILNRAWTFL